MTTINIERFRQLISIEDSIKSLKATADALRDELLPVVEKTGTIRVDDKEFSTSADKGYEYTAEVTEWDKELKKMKAKEIARLEAGETGVGVATLKKDGRKLVIKKVAKNVADQPRVAA